MAIKPLPSRSGFIANKGYIIHIFPLVLYLYIHDTD